MHDHLETWDTHDAWSMETLGDTAIATETASGVAGTSLAARHKGIRGRLISS